VTDWSADDSGGAGQCRCLVGEIRTPTRRHIYSTDVTSFNIVPTVVFQFSVAASYKVKYLSKLSVCDYNVQSVFHQALLVNNIPEWV